MGAGSVPGAVLGGLLVPYAPQALLELEIGTILNVSAWRIFRHTRPAGRP